VTNATAWFPTVPANTLSPYDTGPYVKEALTPVAADLASSAPAGQSPTATTTAAGPQPTGSSGDDAAVTEAAGELLDQLGQLPADQIHEYPDSNAWAVNGSKVDGGGALLGGDPHLPQTLPSIWYEVALSAPGYQVAGASLPGVPGVLLGHNAHIAWSLTDTQNSATLYYAEQVRGDEYYWRGAWRKMTVQHYTIPVRGGATVRLAVDITVHGPIMTQVGQRMAVDWMGNVPSDDLGALLSVNQASDWTQFKAALAGWRAPTQNFTYADNNPVSGQSSGQTGNIGVYAAGYYPQVATGCQPWLPMSGSGQCDISGVIPDNAIPQVYDPPSDVVATDNQRPVAADYPYYVGTSYDFYDPGYRAANAYQTLGSASQLSAADIADLQNNLTDPLAAQIVPKLLAVLGSANLTSAERASLSELSSWNYSMSVSSPAATLWWTFWSDYLSQVFEPWWKAGHVPVGKDSADLAVSPNLASLDEDLQAWTLNAPSNRAFAGPSGRGPADASAAMVTAFGQAVSHLSSSLGGAPSSWAWGRIHSREFPAVSGADGLGYGPRSAGGDPFTEDAADGGLTATAGPSWRMVAALGPAGVSAEGVYPGGQSENPASLWYANLIPLWWDGQYLPVPAPGSVGDDAKWTLRG